MLENSLWKILALVLSVILLFVVPIESILRNQDSISYSLVFTKANAFVDLSREIGYIDEHMYLEMLSEINKTGNTYEIKLEHFYKRYVPEYDDSDSVYLNKFIITYELNNHNNIIEELENTGRYKMKNGDLIYITVKSTSKSTAQKLRETIYNTNTNHPAIFIKGGGMVRGTDI